MRWTIGASLISAAVAAFAPFPVPVAVGSATAPLGFSYATIYGGGYFIGTAGAAAGLGWISESGSYTRVWTETDVAFMAYSTVWAVKWEPELYLGSDYGAVLLTRVDFVGARSAVTAINPYDWSVIWTVALNGTGIAVDIDADESFEQIFVTNGLGGVWTWDFDYSAAPTISDITYGSNALLAPTTSGTFALGAGGVLAIDSDLALVSIVEPGVSKPRFYCLDSSTADPTTWTLTALTFTAPVPAQLDALNYGGALGLIAYTYGDLDLVGFVAAPNAVGTITLLSGAWCETGATYGLNIWNTSATSVVSFPLTTGNAFVAQTFNCDLNVTVALGTSFNGLPTYPVAPAANPYGLYVAAGTLPFTTATGFTPGWDCNSAIEVPASAVVPGVIYDMACYTYSRVLASGPAGLGYGVWFHVNTTGLNTAWSFSTRTAETNFDNYLEFYSACPTTCTDGPSGYDVAIDEVDDSAPTSEPNCGASSNRYCSQYTVDFATTPYDNIYVVMKFLSSPSPNNPNNPLYTSSFQVIPDGANTFNGLPFPTQVCDPRITVPAPPAPPATSAASGGDAGGSDSGSLLSLF